jgi:outer membrane protein TolC
MSSSEENYSLPDLLQQAIYHPLLTQYNLKLSSLNIERKLKLQALLPTVDLKYNQLVKGNDVFKTMNSGWFQNNYRFGLNISMPLRISEERGALKEAILKIENTKLDQSRKVIQLQVKLRQYYTEWQQTTEQVLLQKALVGHFQQLQKGEEIRFVNGESSLFLINAREQKTLEALQKLVEVETKTQKSIAGLKWAAGIL